MEPQTIYTEDRFFVTTGELDFHQSREEVMITLMKYNDYSNWALNGMDGVDKESEGLLAYFTSIDFSIEENMFFVTFDLNLSWPFGRKDVLIKFKPHQTYSDKGDLQSIKLIPIIDTKHILDAELEFRFLENSNAGVSLAYSSKIRLSKFLDFFFSLRSYKRNFEWYVFKVAENLTVYLNDIF